jgi:hypothetical protein
VFLTIGGIIVTEDGSSEIVRSVEKVLKVFVKEVWSILEAASEKKTPSQYLSEPAIRSIQGKEQ